MGFGEREGQRRRREVPLPTSIRRSVGLATLAEPAEPRLSALAAIHEAAHAVVGDLYGLVYDVVIGATGEGEASHTVAPRIATGAVCPLENVTVALAGPAAETLALGTWGVTGTDSDGDLVSAWRSLQNDTPDEHPRQRRLRELFVQSRSLTWSRWPDVTNVAGHLLAAPVSAAGRRVLRVGQVRRVVSGVEPGRADVWWAIMAGT